MLLERDFLFRFYSSFHEKIKQVREKITHPLTLTEKILFSHMPIERVAQAVRGKSYEEFVCDRVAMQDATAQMALLQFMSSGISRVKVPSSVHCDHLIQAEIGREKDLDRSLHESHEVYEFLKTVSAKYGIDFWQPGAGIIHQVVLENYAFPGGLLVGTDSHTPNAGGLGMVAVGVGGSDAVDVMAGFGWELKMPKLIGVNLHGKLQGWASPKDVILKVAQILTVKGGTGYIIEYIGPGARTISCTGKATICNMGAEVGATTSIFPYDESMERYLKATDRYEVVEALSSYIQDLMPDPEVEKSPSEYYDYVIDIDLSTLEPHVNGPYSPDRAWPISRLKDAVQQNEYPDDIKVALIGSCTNSSYEDIQRAASIAQQAVEHGLTAKCPLTITPGSDQIYQTIKRDGLLSVLEKIGGVVLANACGPCIGQWKRHDVAMNEKNTILTSYNRNFSGRNDANPGTHSFVASPEIVIALALSGKMSFNPITDSLQTADGKEIHLQAPYGDELPQNGFKHSSFGLFRPTSEDSSLPIMISPTSERLQKLEPFSSWDIKDFKDMVLLVKAQGKCTTDHISPAGKWLKYRGHLDKISDNLFSGAVNSFHDLIGKGFHPYTGDEASFSSIARSLQEMGKPWIAVGDENYGEGSSREHAAMEPRYLGGKAIIAKSFARIHETNLKKQGVLALHFVHPTDYDKILEDDVFSIVGLEDFQPGKQLQLIVKHKKDGTIEVIPLTHTYTEHQIEWFKAGSALNAKANEKS